MKYLDALKYNHKNSYNRCEIDYIISLYIPNSDFLGPKLQRLIYFVFGTVIVGADRTGLGSATLLAVGNVTVIRLQVLFVCAYILWLNFVNIRKRSTCTAQVLALFISSLFLLHLVFVFCVNCKNTF